jgi:hypothetical protein
MRKHVVRAHTRNINPHNLARPNRLLQSMIKRKIVHVRSYVRGKETSQAKLLVQPKIISVTIDPERKKIEELVDAKLQEVIDKANANKGPYWNKIANFQLSLNGRDWKIVDSYDTGGYGNYEDCQLCGHKGCRFMYVISSGDKQMTIGDECVINYIKDLDTKEVFKKHEKRLRGMVSKTKGYHDLLVDLLLWETRNGTNSFLTNMKNRVMNGNSLSPNMVSAIKRTISKDRPIEDRSRADEMAEDKRKAFELFAIARSKPANDWEKGFIVSIGEALQKGYRLSPKQVAILERIANYR